MRGDVRHLHSAVLSSEISLWSYGYYTGKSLISFHKKILLDLVIAEQWVRKVFTIYFLAHSCYPSRVSPKVPA